MNIQQDFRNAMCFYHQFLFKFKITFKMHKPLRLSLLKKTNFMLPVSHRKARLDCRNKSVIFHIKELSIRV